MVYYYDNDYDTAVTAVINVTESAAENLSGVGTISCFIILDDITLDGQSTSET